MDEIPDKWMSYLLEESYASAPVNTKQALKEALADIIACTIAGTQTAAFAIVNEVASKQWGAGSSSIFMSSRQASASGAALVNATAANALDLDDGHRLVKGHPGAIVFPAVFAAAEETHASGEAFMTALLISYEVSIRAGILAHQLRPEYHCTGSWGAIGAAAGVSRLLGLSEEKINHALGIAEYQSTYSPMMRCIEHPSMLKDGIGWGSMTGVSAAYLAEAGFTGIPSVFATKEAERYIQEFGNEYRINELYYKPYACCRWAQPGIEALKELVENHRIRSEDIRRIIIYTFNESASLSRLPPKNTEEAQYNLTFPIAAYLTAGEVGPKQVLEELENREILRIMDLIEVHISPELNAAFPKKALSRVEIVDKAGNLYKSNIHQAKGDYDKPLSAAEKYKKFTSLVDPILGSRQSEQLFHRIHEVESLKNVQILTELFTNKTKIGGI